MIPRLTGRFGDQRDLTALITANYTPTTIDVPEFISIANALNIAPETLLTRVLRW